MTATLVTGASPGLGAQVARRLGADVVAFVASDAACFVTGERITVNGGHTID